MGLATGERRVEDAHQAKLARHAEHVCVVLVQRVQDARPDAVPRSGCQVLDLALAVEAIAGLHVVPVLQVQLGAGGDRRLRQREAHAVVAHQQSPAAPCLPGHVLRRAGRLVQAPNDHAVASSMCPAAAAVRGAIIGR